ncbi:MAG TPA: hypothetical protein VMI35_00590 [Puia sp.]|nr:hypothetical protein [Puia sp.]
MKKFLIITAVIVGVLFLANSCKKTGGNINPLSSVSNLGVGAYLVLDSNINLNLNYAQIATSTVGIIVHEYPNGQPVDHVIIYAAAGSTYDTTQWHLVKTVSYTGKGTQLTVSGAELGQAFGVDPTTFTPGSFYTFYTRVVTKSGATFDVNNTGNNSGSGLVTGAYYYSAFSFTAYIVCPFTGGMAGSYTVIRDDWDDWSPGATVTVTDGPGANEVNLSQVYPNPSYGTLVNPLVVDVDPASGTAYVHKVNFGNYGGGYNMTAQGTGSGDNAGYVFSCTGYIKVTMELIANGPGGNGYDNGPTTLILQKQ